ncbi:ABC-type transport auxiliary lipoprotein family protein [Sphingorhabdus sp. EL138]|uniref:ABC-type transport auxiliary lipoprotein family protein n=1 Tax=Sphingorhabdus sp. EL138 TaxID=2073156 RepID=UPI0025E0572D|nr:ABC-type transport auxiliary lipoprotein family protein [Sphingorhabdus sp. EL138]
MMFSKISGPRLCALPLIMALGACVSFGGKAPASMLVLTADNVVAAGTARTASVADALVIQIPQVPPKLDTNRVPVQIDASNIAYLKEAFWADKPARLMQMLVAETVSAKSGNLVLNEVDAGGKAVRYISGSLLEFGIDAETSEAVVVYDVVKIIRGSATEKRRFEARRPVTAIAPAPAGAALNAAANDVAGQIADWAG